MKLTRPVTSAAVLLSFVLLVLIVAVWVFFSESGSRFTLNRIQSSLDDVQYDYAGGNLATGVSLANVTWLLKNGTTITSNELTMKWNPWCWRGRQICLKQAASDELSINLVRPKIIRNPVLLKSISLPTELKAEKFNVNKLIINRPDNKPIEIRNVDFSGVIQGTRVSATHLSASWLKLTAMLHGHISLEDNYPLTANGNFSIGIPGKQTIDGDIDLDGDLLRTTIDAKVTQPFTSHVTGVVSPIHRLFPVDLTATQTELRIPFDSVAPFAELTQGQIKVSGVRPAYDIQATANLLSENLQQSTARASGSLTTKKLTIDNVTLSTMDGQISAQGDIDYHRGLRWETDVRVESVSTVLHRLVHASNVSGTTTIRGHKENDKVHLELAEINLSGLSGPHPFTLTGNATRKGEQAWLFDRLAIDSSRNTIRVDGILSDQSDIAVNFTLREPGLFRPGLRGDIFGDFNLTGDKNSPNLAGIARSRQLHFNDVKLTDSRLNIKIKAAGNEPSQFILNAASIRHNKNSFHDAAIEVSGTRRDHKISVAMPGDLLSINNAALSGSLDGELNWMGKVLSVAGNIRKQPVHLLESFPLTWSQKNKTFTVQPNCWFIRGAYGCINEPALIGRDGTVSFTIRGLGLDVFTPLYPDKLQVAGSMYANGEVRWKEFSNPRVNGRASIKNGRVITLLPSARYPAVFELQHASLNIYTRGKQLWSKLKLKTDKAGDISATAMIEPGESLHPIRGNFQLEDTSLQQFLEYYPDLDLQGGVLSANISATGTLQHPLISGKINVADMNYLSDRLPMPFEKINITTELSNNAITVNGFAMSQGESIAISGDALEYDNDWKARLHVSGQNLKYQHDYIKSAVISPDITFTVTPMQTVVTGNIKLNNAFIEIPRLHNTAVPVSSDIVVIDSVEGESGSLEKRYGQSISTNVNVHLGREVFFSGYGLKAQLQGQTNVSLKPKRTPELLGVLNIKSGTYRSYGQALNIRRGRIGFVGPLQQTTLSVEAVRDTGDVLAGIRIDGSLDNPETTLFSDPPMPEEHILPYVVLGRPLEFKTNTDDSQLIANAALFMGISNGRNLTRNVAARIGIDDFSMHATGSGEDTQVQLSGRINDRLLVSYGLGVFNSVNTLFLRYTLAEKFYLETTQGLERAVDVFYSFDFD